MKLSLTLITAKKPEILSKSFTLSEDGTLQKAPGGNLVVGSALTIRPTFHEFYEELKALKPNQAFVYGISTHKNATIVPQKKLQAASKTNKNPIIARDRAHFSWPDGPGILMLDYDPAPNGRPFSRDELLKVLYKVLPELHKHPHIWTASASSCIYRTDGGEELRGIMGQRVYIPVQDARDIPRAGATLLLRFWLSGHGRIEISKSGAALERTVFDGAVWQPERLDFAGGAHCGRGLHQRRPQPILYNRDAPFINTAETLPDLPDTHKRTIQESKMTAREAKLPEIEARQAEWIKERTEAALESVPAEKREAQRKTIYDLYRRAATEKRLLGGFVVHSAAHGPVTVAEVLDNPEKYHEARFADPLEPDYGNDPRIAYANLRGRGYIFSHAHGGQRFTLHREARTIRIEGGELHNIVAAVLEVMRKDGQVYERGELCRIADGQVYPASPGWLAVYLTGLIRFEKWDGRRKSYSPIDCPDGLAKKISDLVGSWGLPRLEGVITAPSITPAGRVIERDGYDPETKLYLEFPDCSSWQAIPAKPNDKTVEESTNILWHPFKDFPFETSVDRGVHLSALLTAVVRQLLPEAPGFLYGAPTAGSGKTLLAKCVSALAGQEPEIYPPTEDEAEMRKRVGAVTRTGTRAIIIDNLVGALKSATLCSFFTTKKHSDRILGESANMSAPTNFMMLFTGNNVTLVGDLNRRILRCVIDPKCERPDKREFELHPFTYVEENRLALVRAALTILEGFVVAGAPKPTSAMGDYHAWSDFIRGAVIWVGAKGWLDVADPNGSTDAGYEDDLETRKLRALLLLWHSEYGNTGSTVGAAKKTQNDDLLEAMKDVAEERGEVNSKRLGNWIKAHEKRVVDGLRFVEAGSRRSVKVWVAERCGFRGFRGTSTTYAREMSSDKYNKGSCENPQNPQNQHLTCDACVNFSPSPIDPTSKPGVCERAPDGRFSRLPSDGADCSAFERITH